MGPALSAVEAPRPQRVFFALWPDIATADALGRVTRAAARACGGRPTRVDTIHLTLAFIGDVMADRLETLVRVASRVVAPQFDLHLDRIGWWRHNRVLWAGASHIDPGLAQLAGQLGSLLGDAGFRIDDRPFAAHVTLLRKADCRAGAERGIELPPLTWAVGEFVLVESVLRPEGASYTPLARFPLLKQA